MDLKQVQEKIEAEQLDGWLCYEFRGTNPLACSVLSLPAEHTVTRRLFYWIPSQGEPVKIVSAVESFVLDHLPGEKHIYRSWRDLHRLLSHLMTPQKKIAMDYSPFGTVPIISKVDGGTIDLIRSFGAQVVTSANLLQYFTSVWTASQYLAHQTAASFLEEVVDGAWKLIADRLKTGKGISEYQVQQWILEQFERNGYETSDAPACAVNAHSADPHYHPSKETSFDILIGDFILIDLWCKQRSSHAVYADITRVGVAASSPTDLQQQVFDAVRKGGDQALDLVKRRYERSEKIYGWEVDRVCRDLIDGLGYGENFLHRTGHNLGKEVHGPGTNLDDFETHDDRELIASTAFTIEPGIYLKGLFGVRLEYDVYLHPEKRVEVNGGIQKKIECLMNS